jgi:hypothetical protein
MHNVTVKETTRQLRKLVAQWKIRLLEIEHPPPSPTLLSLSLSASLLLAINEHKQQLSKSDTESDGG